MLRWLRGRGAANAEVADMQARIPGALWQRVLSTYPFLDALSPSEREALHRRSAWLLASKQMNGARGLELDDFMRLSIAAQAALPILDLPTALYEGWDEIIVYPAGFAIPRSRMDEAGVVHEYVEEAAGEAWEGGPVILSWNDPGAHEGAFNVVIHEFAHKLDLRTGEADGMPELPPGLSPRLWRRVLQESFERYVDQLDAVEASIPRDIDPESPAADPWYASLPLDPYAATDEAEFFAVSSEHFFTDPEPMSQDLPDWYGLLRAYYRQDTLARLTPRP